MYNALVNSHSAPIGSELQEKRRISRRDGSPKNIQTEGKKNAHLNTEYCNETGPLDNRVLPLVTEIKQMVNLIKKDRGPGPGVLCCRD